MNRRSTVAIIGMALASCAFADPDRFSQIVKPDDFAAAGLSKLSPDELARLDQLVEYYKSAALDAARAQAAAEKKASGGGILARAKVLTTPGTKVEHQSVESRMVGKIRGWDAHTVFTLENGQRWEVSDYSRYFNGGAVSNPKVTLTPVGTWGGFKMAIEGVGEMRVRLVGDTGITTTGGQASPK